MRRLLYNPPADERGGVQIAWTAAIGEE